MLERLDDNNWRTAGMKVIEGCEREKISGRGGTRTTHAIKLCTEVNTNVFC